MCVIRDGGRCCFALFSIIDENCTYEEKVLRKSIAVVSYTVSAQSHFIIFGNSRIATTDYKKVFNEIVNWYVCFSLKYIALWLSNYMQIESANNKTQ